MLEKLNDPPVVRELVTDRARVQTQMETYTDSGRISSCEIQQLCASLPRATRMACP